MVSDLIHDKQWNGEVILANFAAEEAALICSIPLSKNHVPDRVIWHYNLKGRFTTKSAYHLAFGSLHTSLTSTSSSMEIPSIWKFIWSAAVPGKIKVHIWKACTSILPTISQLRGRWVNVVGGCSLCNVEEQTIAHVVHDCSFANDLFRMAPSLQSVFEAPPCSVLDWLYFCQSSLSRGDFSLMLILIWGVWKERNQRVWSGKIHSVTQVYFQAVSLFHSFKATRAKQTIKASRRVKPWCPPPVGWLKANLDGAYDENTHRGGVGVVVRDETGLVVAEACYRFDHIMSPIMVEAFAGRLACKLAEDYHLTPIMFESDCLRLVQALQAEGEDTSELGRVIDDISSSLTFLAGSFFTHVYRESNRIAHNLAKNALVSGLQVSWGGSVPPILDGLFATSCNTSSSNKRLSSFS